jgi:glycosyltransferase involved in cell wall biosynthesis
VIIENITNGYTTTKRAAMFYKTEPFYVNVDLYTHTNNWEILQAIKILNQKGFAVDLIDRNVKVWKPIKTYDLFLGLGVGGCGVHFPAHAKASNAPVKILLSMGPQPDISAKLVIERYEIFNRRTGLSVPTMRAPTMVSGKMWEQIVDTADYIFNIGEVGTESYNSFIPYDKPIINFYPSISPKVEFKPEWANSRDRSSFLCFAGNGFICKGVDLVLEAFINNPDKTLHICGPKTERGFFTHYDPIIKKCPNIKYHGFIEPGGDTFNIIAATCSYIIFHSAAEGCCTSVATAMKAGLVPIINKWTGINIENEGIILSENGDLIDNIIEAVNHGSIIPTPEYINMVSATLKKAILFSQDSFIKSYTEAISQVIEKEKILQ